MAWRIGLMGPMGLVGHPISPISPIGPISPIRHPTAYAYRPATNPRSVAKLTLSVSRRENVAGVQADADALRLRGQFQDARQVLEAMAQAGALAGGRFQQYLHAETGTAPVRLVQRRGDALQAALLIAVGRRAGVR